MILHHIGFVFKRNKISHFNKIYKNKIIDLKQQNYIYFDYNKKLKIWLIIGMLNNKNINLFLRKIKPILLGVIPVAIPNEKNAYLAEEIDRVCKNLKLKSFPQNSINKANNFILKKVKPEAILVTGSLYLVGKVRKKYL